jgi:DnaJ like chaperone protein
MPKNIFLPIKHSSNPKSIKSKSFSLWPKLFSFIKRNIFLSNNDYFFDYSFTEKEKGFYSYFNSTNDNTYKYITFTFSFIALAANLARIDGPINDKEIETLVTIFPVTNNHKTKIKELFLSAQYDQNNAKYYIDKLVQLFDYDNKLYQELFYSLIKLSLADKPINNNEFSWLTSTAAYFGLSKEITIIILRDYLSLNEKDPYRILEIEGKATSIKLNKAYRKAVTIYHPDNLCQFDVAEQYKILMTEKFYQATNAYNLIKESL